MIRNLLLMSFVCVIVFCTVHGQQTTICNPMNLGYRFCLDTPSRREAADPTMVVYKGEYYLFASKSGGYFHSTDLIHWDLKTDVPHDYIELKKPVKARYVRLTNYHVPDGSFALAGNENGISKGKKVIEVD